MMTFTQFIKTHLHTYLQWEVCAARCSCDNSHCQPDLPVLSSFRHHTHTRNGCKPLHVSNCLLTVSLTCHTGHVAYQFDLLLLTGYKVHRIIIFDALFLIEHLSSAFRDYVHT